MKQKVVIEISLNGHISQGIIEMLMCCGSQESNQATKIRTKAMKIAVCIPRVESAAMEGEEMNKLTVIGEDIDTVTLVKLLRKNVCFAKIVSVGPTETANTAEDKNEAAVHPKCYNHVPHYQLLEIREPYYTPSCFNF
ncbi:heavy metal-associated isoprenylated plant protein 47-like [Olea europaea var. sylvestris]|uniref:heavy metal-associated isoprenylated plant protein 47-like n=1 Tax=Olea europaea var. sylvestris TaxID=158386 RepID=UPI000C1D4FBA|nr:heavy metal-associated isoprenylated plant protein 47-like [Olea europaea var. sylvestris]